MCGIAGGFGLTNDPHQQIELILKILRRRGPDDAGSWISEDNKTALAHTRLSIQDLSRFGSQPMISHDKNIRMVFNGEIYNFQELRKDLESKGIRFQGNSDSEVLVNLYALYGVKSFNMLNGIFSAGFYNENEKSLVVVRDPLGIKPLYYNIHGSTFTFASEIKALVRSGWVQAEINPIGALHHLSYLWSPGSTTILKGVSKLLPGHYMLIKHGEEPQLKEYTDLRFEEGIPNYNLHDYVNTLSQKLSAAVKRQLVADVPLGAFLSGGLDSSSIAAFAQKSLGEHRRLQCFTIKVPDHNTNQGFV